MPDLHIEEFYKDVAKILLQMYRSFPRKSQVFVEDISGPDQPDEYGIHSARHQSCFAAMLWLSEEGFIRYQDTIRQEAIDQAVITQETFLRLTGLADIEPADSVQPTTDTAVVMTNIELIQLALRSATSTNLATLMEHVLFNHR
ncbi:hypothetical protein [Hahella ganghwensis]|uniref:hypothetical protein n=1 Tax=Hahella ganghwensis TaxID=286420 RepID=UPI000382B943|nr:hypothetical protein [Hahella ganghwensis]